jgi:pre-mRNA-splicing factor CDC5/CEF1
MPCQWRTIAPLVGRTAQQCLEHYEKLLDAAQERQLAPHDDPRRLRPGEIDPVPETKPARPDPIDMDEDEKEMLSEARARLANTLGKKAKRKARERQLDEARRLASIQKRREQKMAGIAQGHARRNLKKDRVQINYNEEIPFFKPVPAGLHDVSAELAAQRDRRFQEQELSRLEGVKKQRAAAAAAAADKAKMAKRKRDALPDAIAQINAAVDGALSMRRRRAKLSLPRPMLDEDELERVAKAAAAAARELTATVSASSLSSSSSSASASSSAATAALFDGASATPQQQQQRPGGLLAMRTPRGGGGGGGGGGLDTSSLTRDDKIKRDAALLAQLAQQQTPLAGGDSVSVKNSDFTGVTPLQRQARTPNVLATPLGARGQLVGGTPLRDALQINSDDEPYSSASEQRAAQRRAANELRGALAMLPAPTNEYEIVVPAELPPAPAGDGDDALELDEVDRLAKLREHQRLLSKLELERSSTVLRRDLTRPLAIAPAPAAASGGGGGGGTLAAAAAMIEREMRALLVREHVRAVPSGGAPASSALRREAKADADAAGCDDAGVPNDVALDGALMAQARDLLAVEQAILRSERGLARDAVPAELATLDAFRSFLSGEHSSLWEPRSKRAVVVDAASASDLAAARRAGAELAYAHAQRLRAAATALAADVSGGEREWAEQCAALSERLARAHAEHESARQKRAVYEALAAQEARASSSRLARSKADVQDATQRELQQQARYQALLDRRDELLRA